jgi:small GTP-binding protein
MSHTQVCVLGEGGVGKTALTIRLCSDRFVTEYDPTIEDSYRKQLVVNGRAVMVEILDTAGQEEFKAQRDEWIRDSDGFVIVYSITSRTSFDNIKEFYDTILRVKDGEELSIALAGNKADLDDKRAVSTEDGAELAARLGAQFRETSAKTRMNI